MFASPLRGRNWVLDNVRSAPPCSRCLERSKTALPPRVKPFLLPKCNHICHVRNVTTNKDKLPILEENPDAVPLDAQADKPALPAHIWRTNSRGLIEAIDVSNGRVLAMQTSYEDLLKNKWERLVKIDTPQGPVYLERGLNFDLVSKLRDMPFSNVIADLVCQEVANGSSIIKACQKLNLEYATISRWKREQESFRLGLEHANKDRAQYLADEVLDEAREKAAPKDKIAALQWAAEKGDAEFRY